jgi:hypothetical protein
MPKTPIYSDYLKCPTPEEMAEREKKAAPAPKPKAEPKSKAKKSMFKAKE